VEVKRRGQLRCSGFGLLQNNSECFDESVTSCEANNAAGSLGSQKIDTDLLMTATRAGKWIALFLL